MRDGSMPAKSDMGAMTMVTMLFFMWGFLTCLNDILIPHLKSIFDLNYADVMLIQFAFFSSYFIFSLPSGKLIERVGYQRAMVLGLITMGIGAAMFVPAAILPAFPLFLTALIVLAGGMTILQTAANPYVAVLGPPRTAASRLNLTQAFNSLGTTIAPKFGSWLILGAVAAPLTADVLRALPPARLQAYRVEQASSVKVPYLGLAVCLFLLAVVIARFKFPVISTAEGPDATNDSVWRHGHLLLGALAIFVYVGAEVAIGSLLTNYINQREIGNLSLKDAAGYLPYYWGGAMVGRFVGSALLQRVSPRALLGLNGIVALLLVMTSILSTGHIAIWSLILVGLFNSIMFPTIFTLAIEGLGSLTGKASGVLVAAIVGGAIIPELQGVLSDRIGIHHAFVVPAICYLYVALYGFKFSKPAKTRVAQQTVARAT